VSVETFNPGHMRHVRGAKIILLLLLLIPGSSLLAQHSGHQFMWARRNNPEYDRRKITYGFSIGLHTSAYQIKYSDKYVSPQLDTLVSVDPPFIPGFSLGFLVNFRLHDMLDVRIMPKAGFYTHELNYRYLTSKDLDPRTEGVQKFKTQIFETTMVEVPFLIKYKSMRRGNVRMYMVGGITPAIEASGKRDIQSSTSNFSINKGNLSIDAGMGFDFYFPLFKLSQEIRFSRGIVNILGDEASSFKEPILRMNTNTISVYFIFQ